MRHAEFSSPDLSVPPRRTGTRPGVRIEVHGLGVVRHGREILQDVTLTIEPGELVGVVGLSGAGKSTLLDAMAGVRRPTSGTVRFDGVARGGDRADDSYDGLVGYVPQDDIIHTHLPVEATLRYAARLRLREATGPAVDRAVALTLARLELADRAAVRVADLSGGQRKRTSIGVELLTAPRAFFLDEPTSGLDPETATNLVRTLRLLADDGATVVLTTHRVEDLRACDRVVVVAGGRLAFSGSPDQARRHFAVEHLADLPLRAPVRQARVHAVADRTEVTVASPLRRRPPPPGAVAQWRVLTARNVDVLRRDRLTLAVMLAAPALVIAMFTMLFRRGALDAGTVDPAAAVGTSYWMVFAAFFFGLTYGLLQICTERAILQRERFVGLRPAAYLAAKLTMLAPVLAAVDAAMLAVLRGLGRLPALGTGAFTRVLFTLVLTSLAALGLGLLASAAVADPAQATLALPLLCFPAVLFAGAVLPVPTMDVAGRAASLVVVARWAFEAVGHDLGLSTRLRDGGSTSGRALLAQYGDAFDRGVVGHWAVLGAFAVAFVAATAAVVQRRTAPGR